jgi:hypothetical protein
MIKHTTTLLAATLAALATSLTSGPAVASGDIDNAASPMSAVITGSRDSAPQIRDVLRRRAKISVIGQTAGPYIPGQVPSQCEDTTFTVGQPFKVRDARTGTKLATGTVDGCTHQITSDPVCIPGLGCTPSLVSPVWQLRILKGLPYVGVRKYTFIFSGRRYTVTRKALIAENWTYLFGDPN